MVSPKAKKTASQKTVAKKTSAAKNISAPTMPESTVDKSSNMSIRIKWIIAALLLIGLLYQFKHVLVAAVVNGKPVSRLSVVKELEKQAGKSALEAIISKKLIFDQLRKEGVQVEQTVVDKEVETIRKSITDQGQNFDELLALQGMTLETLKEQVRIQQMIEKKFADKVVVSEKEIDAYIKENDTLLTEGASLDETRKDVRQQLEEQKLRTVFNDWFDKLKKEAKIWYLVNY